MKKRWLQIVILAGVLALVAVWALYYLGKPENDETRYQRWLQANISTLKLHKAERRYPGLLVRLLRLAGLEDRYAAKAEDLEKALLASGYITNASITVTNLSVTATDERTRLVEITLRLQRRLRGVDFWGCGVESNQVSLTCRTKDWPLIRRAVESP